MRRLVAILVVVGLSPSMGSIADVVDDANRTLDKTERTVDSVDRATTKGTRLFDRFRGWFGRSGDRQAAPAAASPQTLEAQQLLALLGLDPGPLDGRIGPRTIEAVRQFQRGRGLPVDGRLGPATLAALREAAVSVRAGGSVVPPAAAVAPIAAPVATQVPTPVSVPAPAPAPAPVLAALDPRLLDLVGTAPISAAADAHHAACAGQRDGRFRDEFVAAAGASDPASVDALVRRYDDELTRVWPQVAACEPLVNHWFAMAHRQRIAAIHPAAIGIPPPAAPAAIAAPAPSLPAVDAGSGSTVPAPQPAIAPAAAAAPAGPAIGASSAGLDAGLVGSWYWMQPGEGSVVSLRLEEDGRFALGDGEQQETGSVIADGRTLVLTPDGTDSPESFSYAVRSANEVLLTDTDGLEIVLLRNPAPAD